MKSSDVALRKHTYREDQIFWLLTYCSKAEKFTLKKENLSTTKIGSVTALEDSSVFLAVGANAQ